MAKTKTKAAEGVELLENPELIAGRAEQFFSEKKNQLLVSIITGAITVALIGYFGYNYFITTKNAEAQEEMFQAVFYFEADSLGLALNGDGNNLGFLQVISDYAGTDAANLSYFYAGATYLKLGDFQNAVRYLEDFSSDDDLLPARASVLIGDAYLELGQTSDAIDAYAKAVSYKPNKDLTPTYLVKLATAYEVAGDYKKAADTYSKIIDKYSESALVPDAKKHKARLNGLAAG